MHPCVLRVMEFGVGEVAMVVGVGNPAMENGSLGWGVAFPLDTNFSVDAEKNISTATHTCLLERHIVRHGRKACVQDGQ